MMEVGELVTVRLEETGSSRFLLPGIIVRSYKRSEQLVYDILCRGEIVTVTNLDIGPADIFLERKRLEKRWNENEDV